MDPIRPNTIRTLFGLGSTSVRPISHVLIKSASSNLYDDVALVVASGYWKPEKVVGIIGVIYAGGVIDGEAKDGASAGTGAWVRRRSV